MADASFLQTNFLGGEWSPFAQGRADMEQYRTACNVMLNYVALEVGAATRRSGTRTAATTRDGVYGVLRQFHFSQALPFEAEFTAGHMRLFSGTGLLLENLHNIVSISTATPAVVQTVGSHLLTTGQQVEILSTQLRGGITPAGLKAVFNKQFVATVIDATHVSLSDPVTGAPLNGSTISTLNYTLQLARVVDFTTPYLQTELDALRLVQNEAEALVLHTAHPTQQLTNTIVPTANQLAVFSFAPAVFLDGPYLDPPTDGSTLQASALSGTITLTASATTSINGGQGFLATDVGRLMRLFSEPPAWAAGTTYAKGANITYGNVQWQAIAGSTGVQPDTDPGTHWVINPTGAIWTWGTIASVVSTTQVTLTLAAADPLGVLAGGSLLYSGGSNLITQWQMGLYSATTGYPGVGCFHEGRFWLGGVTANRLDSTQANAPNLNFGPTLLDGSVPDDCGISAIFQGPNRNTIFWALPDHQGVIVGTQGGEWLMQASQLNEPLTPTSIQAHLVTQYGVANIEPRSTGLSHVFVHRYQLQLYEYITDVFSGKFIGTNIGRKAKHVISPGIAEIAYQAEKAPIVWARTTDGRLLGCTYKRESPFSTQPASYMAWHHHPLGSNRKVTGIQAGPAPSGATDSLALVTQDTVTGIYYVEFLSDLPEETDTLLQAWYLDGAAVPSGAFISGSTLTLYGLQYLAGDTITAWIGGVDAGDYVVAADGTVTITLGTAGPNGTALLTQSFLASLTGTFGALNLAIQVTPPGLGNPSPVGAALDYVATSNAPLHYNATTQFDWDANRIYHQQAAAGGDPETNGHTLFIFNLATRAVVAGPLDPGNLANGIPTLGYDGNVYYSVGLSANAGRWNATSQTNDITYTDAHSLHAVGTTVALTDGIDQYLVYGGLNSGQGGPPADSSPVAIINMTAPSPYPLELGHQGSGTYEFLSADEHPTSVSPGNVVFSRGPLGSAYAAFTGPEGGSGTFTLGLYRVMLDGPLVFGVPKIGAQACTAFDAGWTSVGVNTMVYDETDGNVVLLLTGTGNSNAYLVKLNTATGAIIWQLQIHTAVDFHTSRIRGGRLSIIDGPSSPWPLKFIDTIGGTVLTSTNETVIGPNQFSTDDGAGGIVVEINDIGTTMWATFGCTNTPTPENITPAVVYNSPAVIGFTYNSDLQILRPVSPQESGAANGPAQGKTKRVFRAAPFFANTVGCDQGIGVKMGTYFTRLRSVRFQSAGGTVPLTPQQLFTGIYRDTVDDDYSFNGMWCCRTARPYPTTVVSVESFLHTQDL